MSVELQAPPQASAAAVAAAKLVAPRNEALRLIKAQLSPETALLGFAGAPWTLATYLAAGAGKDQRFYRYAAAQPVSVVAHFSDIGRRPAIRGADSH